MSASPGEARHFICKFVNCSFETAVKPSPSLPSPLPAGVHSPVHDDDYDDGNDDDDAHLL